MEVRENLQGLGDEKADLRKRVTLCMHLSAAMCRAVRFLTVPELLCFSNASFFRFSLFLVLLSVLLVGGALDWRAARDPKPRLKNAPGISNE